MMKRQRTATGPSRRRLRLVAAESIDEDTETIAAQQRWDSEGGAVARVSAQAPAVSH
jgi:hypothetical protein